MTASDEGRSYLEARVIRLGTMAKRGYVASIRVLRIPAQKLGVLGWLDKRLDRPGYHWLRALFAIHDVDEMIALDVPWWTYRAIDAVDVFLQARPDATVFEYGSGASTVWLARRAAVVDSVEHDATWFALMQERLGSFPNVTLRHAAPDQAPSGNPLYHSQKENALGQSFETYVHAIAETGRKYDLIIIDGRAREACLSVAQSHLAEDGMIVFDNSTRKRYQSAIGESVFKARHLSGLTPSLPYPDQTTLLRRALDKASDG